MADRQRWGRKRPTGYLAAVLGCVLALLLPSLARASDDPMFAQQWGLQQVGAPSAWAISQGAGVLVGIVDTGVDLQHEDLAGQVAASTNCIGSNGDPALCTGNGQDDNGHGTHVAGIIAALEGNGKGIAGVAPKAHLLVAKALDASGSGADLDVEAGIKWVVDHGAKVINLSLGDANILPLGLGASGGAQAPLTDGINYAWSHGAIPVLAAGNNAHGALTSLGGGLLAGLFGADANFGSLPAIIVGATGPNGALASYSSLLTNDQWAVVAPGGAQDGNVADNVLSTYWVSGQANQYASLAGTSMATPHVVGAVADVLATGVAQADAVQRILTTADKSVPCGSSCSGLLDVSSAVGGPVTPPPPGGPAPTGGGTGDLLSGLLSLLGL